MIHPDVMAKLDELERETAQMEQLAKLEFDFADPEQRTAWLSMTALAQSIGGDVMRLREIIIDAATTDAEDES